MKVPIPAVNNAVDGSSPTSNGTKTVAPSATKRNCTPTNVFLKVVKLFVSIIFNKEQILYEVASMIFANQVQNYKINRKKLSPKR